MRVFQTDFCLKNAATMIYKYLKPHLFILDAFSN